MKKILLATILIISCKTSFSQALSKACLSFTNPLIVSNSSINVPISGCFEVSNVSFNVGTNGKNPTAGLITFDMSKDEKSPLVWAEYLQGRNAMTFEIAFFRNNEVLSTNYEYCKYKFKNAFVNSFENSNPKTDKITMFVGAYFIEYTEIIGNSGQSADFSIGRDFLLNIPWNGL